MSEKCADRQNNLNCRVALFFQTSDNFSSFDKNLHSIKLYVLGFPGLVKNG